MGLKVYNFKCCLGHAFEAMVPSAEEAERQIRSGFLTCPVCGSSSVERTLSAPHVGHSTHQSKPVLGDEKKERLLREVFSEFKKIVDSAEDVGNRLVEEVRSIKAGDAPSRMLKGTASPEDVKQLVEEGVDILPIPHIPTPESIN